MTILTKAIIIGLVLGIIDIIPMIVRKLPRYTTVSAFIHYFIVSIVIVLIDIPGVPWWLEGGLLGILLMTPMLIHVGHTEKSSVPIIASLSILLGTLAGIIGHYWA